MVWLRECGLLQPGPNALDGQFNGIAAMSLGRLLECVQAIDQIERTHSRHRIGAPPMHEHF